MIIRHKGMERNITTDAPFIGTRINAIGCSKYCPGCFNQDLNKSEQVFETPVEDIIRDIAKSKIDQGIILGGLEWSEQPLELQEIAIHAINAGLSVMIYTHLTMKAFMRKVPLLWGHDILVKSGEYIQKDSSYYNSEYDVYLAGTNQQIYNIKNL